MPLRTPEVSCPGPGIITVELHPEESVWHASLAYHVAAGIPTPSSLPGQYEKPPAGAARGCRVTREGRNRGKGRGMASLAPAHRRGSAPDQISGSTVLLKFSVPRRYGRFGQAVSRQPAPSDEHLTV
jgi:hypothetical protein